jgi:hypothetical protein
MSLAKYISFKNIQKKNNSYSPDNNNKKFLVVMACHVSTKLKLETIRKNLRYFAFHCIDIALVVSSNQPFNNEVANICSKYSNVKYYETENRNSLDFGKWHWLLSQIDYNIYDYVVLVNDSFIIHSSLNHYLNLVTKYDVDLYGYNDSTGVCYHYQSYLFTLKKNAIPTFLTNVGNNLPLMNIHWDVVSNGELMLTKWFPNHKCFLKIGNIPLNHGHNIFFNNDALYIPLKKNGLLPFSKLKRVGP